MSEEQNGWNEYSKLVINELERLNEGISNLNSQIIELKHEIVELKGKEESIKDLKSWKKLIDEVSSPTQLKELSEKVTELTTFKTQAITIFLIVQGLMGLALGVMKFFN
jgi:cell division septum initiation protein DivIVA